MTLDGADRSDLWGGRSSGGPGCAAEVSEVRLGGEGTLILAGSQIAPPAGPRAVGRRRQQQGWRSNLAAACFHPSTNPHSNTDVPLGQTDNSLPTLSRSNWGEQQLLGRRRRMSMTERPPGGSRHVWLQLGNMSTTSDILSLTLLGGGWWRITYAAVKVEEQQHSQQAARVNV